MTMNFNDFTEYAKRQIIEYGENFTDPDDDWPMMVAVYHPGDGCHTWEIPGWVANNPQIKHAYAKAMAMAIPSTKPTMLAFMSSTWMVKVQPEGPPPETDEEREALLQEVTRVPPSQHPDRVENVMCVVADLEIETMWTAEIKRSADGPPVLGEWQDTGRDPVTGKRGHGQITGAMVDPWRAALR